MIESFVGIIIATAASVSLLTTIAVSNKSIKRLGLHPLTKAEKRVVEKAGYSMTEINALDNFVRRIKLE